LGGFLSHASSVDWSAAFMPLQRPFARQHGSGMNAALHGRFSSKAILFLLAASVAITSAGCSKSGGDADDKTAGAQEKAPAEAKPGVTVDADTQARVGLKIETPAPMKWEPEMKVYGQVLDPAPLMDLAMDLRRAEIALDSSSVELDRARQLKTENNISAKAFHDAETTHSQNLADAQAARFKIQTAWGRKVADMLGPIEAPAGTERTQDKFLDGLRETTALIRVDLPPGERLENQGQTARIVSFANGAQPVTATCFDLLPALDPQTQQQGVLFSADQTATNRLTPGEAVTAYIKMRGEPVSGVVVPDSAVLRHEGKAWVYVQTDTNQFLRVEMPLDRQTDGGWFVSENVSATNHIVTGGAQTVLSAELSGGAFTTGERD
jgi:multidrug efflux pump subunit AcrA (membrane-fusion protein)